MQHLAEIAKHEGWKYVELRPTDLNFEQTNGGIPVASTGKYVLHFVDIRPDAVDLFTSLHKNSVQQTVRRAERLGIIEKSGRSEKLLKEFYRLVVVTRSRQHVPPQPYEWFQNLVRCLGDALEFRVAYWGEIAVASIMTIRFRDTVYYKYAASDAKYHNVGGTAFLMWRAIVAAKLNGAVKFDLGRTDEANVGLITFKNRWVPDSKQLTYWRFPAAEPNALDAWKFRTIKIIFGHMPMGLLTVAGRVLYRHIG